VTSGYSDTPLPRKLGIKPGHLVLLDNAPAGFALDGVDSQRRLGRGPYDVAVLFCPDRARLERRWEAVAGASRAALAEVASECVRGVATCAT